LKGGLFLDKYWKVLIADDQPVIREGIREAIDWEAIQMIVVGEAEDGEEALELALEQSVDILLVDLNMPIMNGITLIGHIREQLPECKIVIITGHDEFTYTQKAIRLNVDDYILKPANPEQLKSVLEHVCEELEKTVQESKYSQIVSNQMMKNFSILRQRFCLEWIGGNMEEEEIMEQLQFLQLPVECPKQFGIIQCPEFYANKPLLKEQDRQLLVFSMENIVSELLEPYQKVVFYDYSGFMIICLWADMPEEQASEIQKALKQCLKVTPNLYFSKAKGEMTKLPDVYKECKMMIYKDSNISPIVRRAREYIQSHFEEPDISLESLAQSLQVSPVYLSRIIKQELGMSFVSLIADMRMKKAIQLLTSTDLSILEIAECVGYDSQHYFSTAFKKMMGMPPNQYRKRFIFPEDISIN